MIIELGIRSDHFTLHLQGGWVSKEVCELVDNALKADCWNFRYIGGRQSSLGLLGNEIEILFNFNARREDCQEFVDYLNMILRNKIATGFTVIHASPYDLPDYDNHGGLDLLLEISKETHCEYDPGTWGKPFVFKPENNLQYNQVIELLREFKMKFNNWDYVAGKRDYEV